jgi:predicted GNAT superfamily acetyltransferase
MSAARSTASAAVSAGAAHREAAAAAERAGVEIRPVTAMDGLHAIADLFARIWSGSSPPIGAEHLRALAHAGNYVVGAYDGATGDMVAASEAFFAEPIGVRLHSDMTGADSGARDRGVGLALKLHQRAWARDRGLAEIVWTFDPLVARNAYFNIAKLGVGIGAYHVDFYGDMDDAVNAGQGSDRLLAVWQLGRELPSAGAVEPEAALLARDSENGPVVESPPASARRLGVAVPADIYRVRDADPARALAWRTAVRETLGAELAAGGRVIGFTERCGYIVETAPTAL